MLLVHVARHDNDQTIMQQATCWLAVSEVLMLVVATQTSLHQKQTKKNVQHFFFRSARAAARAPVTTRSGHESHESGAAGHTMH